MKTSRWKTTFGALTALAATVLIVGCGLNGPGAEPLTGPTSPAEFGLSVTLTASPDQLPRDGNSQSTITVVVRDAQARPVSGQRLSVGTTVGSVSQSDIVTNADGRATFTFTAPPVGTVGNSAVVQVTPVGGGSSTVGRNVSILLTGGSNSTAPTPAFTVNPGAPVLQQPVVFDATTTTDEGAACRDACSYSWDFGGEASATGRVVTYRFTTVRTYPVTLTVTDVAGATAKLTTNVVVTEGTAPTAAITFSPTSPGQFETIQFTAEASRVGVTGRTITSYQWRFGDGGTATGITATHKYDVLGTYPVVLTVTDSAGVQGTATQNVVVVNGVTASFVISPSPTTTTRATFFDAEGSLGSESGFGGRNTIKEYIWNFGDSTSTETTTSRLISHTFTATGAVTVTLTVVDTANRRATTNRGLTVN